MKDKIIKIEKLRSGATAIILETKTGLAIEIGTGTVSLDEQDLYAFIQLLKEVDRHFLSK